MKKEYLAIFLLLALTIGSGLILSNIFGASINTKTYAINVYDGTKYQATVCVYKNGELIECKHNVLTTIGKNFTQQQLINPQTANKTAWITLSNVSTDCPSDGSATKLANEIITANLGKASCTLTSINASSWSCEKTFQATGSVSNVQVAGYNWNATAGANDLFACATFTAVNIESGDSLTIRWNTTIS
jgi:hypothetical protein